MAGLVGTSYTINGIKVQFPHKAYPSQLSMMDKIIKGLERRQNCLLESPTGSGKSLALLCSALAWVNHEKEKIEKEEMKSSNDCCCQCQKADVSPLPAAGDSSHYFAANNNMPPPVLQSSANVTCSSNAVPGNPPDVEDEELDDDFKTENKKFRTPQASKPNLASISRSKSPDVGEPPPAGPPAWGMEVTMATILPAAGCCTCQQDDGFNAKKKKIPKIYFGTRTHKQIAQITRELGKTAYRHNRMTILASREHTCIDPVVSRSKNKNEGCKEKLDASGCRFKDRVQKICHSSVQEGGLDSAWDLEDFVSFCTKSKACPYFGSRQLTAGADIVFCPYNYLIEPMIREAMEINLKDQIVILDEAHNIEDCSRDAASFSTTQDKIQEAKTDIMFLVREQVQIREHETMHEMLNSFDTLIERNHDSLEGGDYDQASRVWMGLNMVAQLKMLGLGVDKLEHLKKSFATITADDEDTPAVVGRRGDKAVVLKVKAPTRQLLGGLLMVLDYIYRKNMKYMEDYRVAIVRTMNFSQGNTNAVWLNASRGRRRGRNQGQPMEPTVLFTLNFWCLNPAVAFSDLGECVRSVVLTSGTLSPMTSFQSELDIPFPIQLEANHVISNSQVWVGTISRGPRGNQLLGNYQTMEQFGYQDDVGWLVVEVCQTVPFGVLCFLPSYKTLDKLIRRWKNTQIWPELLKLKEVMVEPRAADKEDFDALLKHFYEVIDHCSNVEPEEEGSITGALLLAVCRGKVSEGMDFTDNNARAVITVGIPYPNFKDTQIELKKKYNDERSASRGLLRGKDWYDIQAYRAINQALGRCIRHRNDWGALILVDERFAKQPQKYIKGLSKWVRQRVQYYNNFQQARTSLATFTKERLERGADQNSCSVSMMETSMAMSCLGTPTQRPLVNGINNRLQLDTPTSTVVTTNEQYSASSISLLIDTNANTVSAPTGPARYMNISQAGGFLPTQNQVTQKTQQGPHPVISSVPTPTQFTQVVAGSDQQQMVTDCGITATQFNPPLASTQLGLTPGAFDVTNDDNLDTQQAKNEQEEIKTPKEKLKFESPQNRVERLGRIKSKLAEYKQNPVSVVAQTPIGVVAQSVADGSMYQFVCIPAETTKPESNMSRDEVTVIQDLRSNSPVLFDGDESPRKDNVMADRLHIDEKVLDHVENVLKSLRGSQDYSLPSLVQSPQYHYRDIKLDPKMELASGSDVLPINELVMKTVKVAEHRKTRATVTDKSVYDALDFGEEPKKESGKRPLFKSRKSEEEISKPANPPAVDEPMDSGVRSNRGRLCRRQSIKSKEALSDVSINCPSIAPTTIDSTTEITSKEVEVSLNTRRTSRGKRRRTGNTRIAPRKRGRGVEYDDSDPGDKPCAAHCPGCGTVIAEATDVQRETRIPSFLQTCVTQHADTTASSSLCASHILRRTLVPAPLTPGSVYNSCWSSVDKCCVQFMHCASCQDDENGKEKGSWLGAEVVAVGENSKQTVGQVWLLDVCEAQSS